MMLNKQAFHRRVRIKQSPVQDKALKLYVNGNVSAALAVANDIIDGYKPNVVILDLVALCHWQLGNPEQAMSYWQQAVRVDPNCADAYSNMGAFLKEQTRFDESEAAYRQAVRIRPEHADSHFNLGNILMKQGRRSEAEAAYREGLRLNPDNTDLGRLYESMWQDNAQANKETSVLPNAGNDDIQGKSKEALQIGISLHKSGRLDEAIHWYRITLEIDSENAVALANMGVALQDKGEMEEAIECCKKAILIKHDLADAHYNLGNVLRDMGRLEPAVASYQTAISIKPDFADVHNNLGNTLRELGKLDLAVESYQTATAIRPDYAEAHNNLGVALYITGKLDLAVASCQTAISIKPDYAEAYSNLGTALHDLNKLDLAVASYQTAISIKPDYADAMYNLHAILCDNNPKSAIRCLEKAVGYAPHDMKIRFFLDMLNDYTQDTGFTDAYSEHSQMVGGLLDSWQYIKSTGRPLPSVFGTTRKGLSLGLDHACIDGLILEFGVRHGTTIRHIASLVKQDVHGFDSFQGLPESWHDTPQGAYSTYGELPVVPDNVFLHVGLFEETLPVFLEKHSGPVCFLNVDCDLYSSAKTVLDLLADRIIPGTVIVFDEYFANKNWKEDEYKAFQESVRNFGWHYQYIGFSLFSKQVVIVMK